MMNNDRLLFIVEGEKREIDYFEAVDKDFFSKPKSAITISIPAEMNIYMLYSILKENGFFTDIIEILRERVDEAKKRLAGLTRYDFAGVYLFFDFDGHSNNLGNMDIKDYCSVVEEMVAYFGDPSDEGKLYISYPMIEALRDRREDSCLPYSEKCFVSRDEFEDYKRLSANPSCSNVTKYSFKQWRDVFFAFARRCCCLMNVRDIDRDDFLTRISQGNILKKEIDIYLKSQCVFILPCIPCFLLEYSQKNWDATLGNVHKAHLLDGCKQKQVADS